MVGRRSEQTACSMRGATDQSLAARPSSLTRRSAHRVLRQDQGIDLVDLDLRLGGRARQTAETVNLVRVHGARMRYEAVLEGKHSLRSLPALGQPMAAHCSALGKSILAGSPEPMRRLLLGPEPYQRLTANTITHSSALEAELTAVSQLGYALDEEENEPGLTCVAAAIRGPDDRPIAAISITGLSERMRKLDPAELGHQLRSTC